MGNFELLLFYMFIVVVIIQIIYYLFIFGKLALLKPKATKPNKHKVSVIICAIYSNKYHNISVVNVEQNETFWGNKKYALTLGIKAAKYDYLLLTDADCKPLSRYWIKQMSAYFEDNKSIVLGYGAYEKVNYSFLNKLIRFETLLTAVQYFSYALLGNPYMGVGRNLAYKKEEFYNNNGFVDHMDVLSGDDDLFINQIAQEDNVTLNISPYSFTKSQPETTFKNWFQQKKRHVSTSFKYKIEHKIFLSLFYISQLLFWLISILLLISQYKFLTVLILFASLIIIKYIVLGISAKKLREKDLILFLPILEVFLICFQFSIFISNLFSKQNLLDTFWNQVYGFQLKRTENENDAEDITIQTFSKAFDKINTYNEDFKFSTWLITISKNIHIDLLRKRKTSISNQTIDDSEERVYEIIDESPTPEDKIIREQNLAKMSL